ncbi:glycosyl hydrolase family 1 [Dietzia kunjamensis]|uniref:family 1 glycosylhydrolase n=1 Tax=Dietzia kunjamensis TaxID=322509 RepID=UPI000FF3A5A2|nr:glycosyl hydrolase family 1 [Dietzia kunjamensis]
MAVSPPREVHAATPQDISSGVGFHWGVATSGFQVEGSNPDSNWKRYTDSAAPAGQADPVGDAVDFWNRYEEDIANAAASSLWPPAAPGPCPARRSTSGW